MPEPLSIIAVRIEDLNTTCTRYKFRAEFSYEGCEQCQDTGSMKECVELGKSQCNAILQINSWRYLPTDYQSILVSDLSSWGFVDIYQSPRYYHTHFIGDCSIWHKWSSYYLSSQLYNDEMHLSLADAQKSCHLHGPLCYAVKKKEEKYYLMRYQEMPSQESETLADYWIKLATYN